MLKHEFENLIGREATDEEYTKANGIYMSTNFTKQEFCKEWDAIKDSKVLTELNDRLDYAADKADKYSKIMKAAAEVIIDEIDGMKDDEDLDLLLSNLIGRKDAIRIRIDKGIALTKLDRDYICENLI